MLADLLDSNSIEQFAEPAVLVFEAPLKRSDVGAERMSNLADGCAPGRHEKPDRLLDLFGNGSFARAHHCTDEVTCVSCERRVGTLKRAIQIGLADDDSVEVRPEVHLAIKQALVERPVRSGRAFIAEAYALRPPAFRHDCS